MFSCRYVDLVGADFFYTPYETKIQAKNDKGDGPITDAFIIYSAEERKIINVNIRFFFAGPVLIYFLHINVLITSPVSMIVGCCLTPCHNCTPIILVSTAVHHSIKSQSALMLSMYDIGSLPLSLLPSTHPCRMVAIGSVLGCVLHVLHT